MDLCGNLHKRIAAGIQGVNTLLLLAGQAAAYRCY